MNELTERDYQLIFLGLTELKDDCNKMLRDYMSIPTTKDSISHIEISILTLQNQIKSIEQTKEKIQNILNAF